MAFPIPPGPFNPIPNGPFYSPESSFVYGDTGSLIVGAGLAVNYVTGELVATGGPGGAVVSITAGPGIFASASTGNVLLSNAGVLDLNAGAGISVSKVGGVYTITNTSPASGPTGTVTSVNTGAGLTGGPITSSGTISLTDTGVAASTYTNPTITVDAQGRITYATNGAAGSIPLLATAPLQITASVPQTISIAAASTIGAGAVQLNSSTNSTSTTQAATPSAVKEAYDIASTAGTNSTNALNTANNALTSASSALTAALAAIPCAAFTAKGQVLVGTSYANYSALPPGAAGQVLTVCAACPSGLYWSTPSTATGTVFLVQTGAGLTGGPITTTGTIALANTAVTPGFYSYASFTVDAKGRIITASSNAAPNTSVVAPITNVGTSTSPVIGIRASSTTQPGAVQLNNTLASTSTTEALTAAQGKALQDQISALSITSNLTLAGTFNAATSQMLTVTADGTAAGFAIGSNLPAATGLTDYFVIVTTAGSYSPPGGGGPYTANQGDWFLSNGTVWEFLNVGTDLPIASTGTQGIVQLATSAQTQAGTSTTLAVTPSGAAATYVPLSAYLTQGTILAATAAGTPTALPIGTNAQVLTVDTTCPQKLKWAAVSCGTVTSITTGTGLTGGTITTSGTIALSNTAVTAGSYTNANITVDAQGRITAAANGSGGLVTAVSGVAPITSTGGTTPAIGITTATTAACGAVQLATLAEVTAGTNSTKAVTPNTLAATYMPLSGGTFTGPVTFNSTLTATGTTCITGPLTTTGTVTNCGAVGNCSTVTTAGATTNIGAVTNCALVTNCSNVVTCGTTTNVGAVTNCALVTNCGNVVTCGTTTNVGAVTNCALVTNCSNVITCGTSTNVGAVTNCALVTNCSNTITCGTSTNVGAVTNCGSLTTCGTTTNVGTVTNCGNVVTCGTTTNTGTVTNCGDLITCGATTNVGAVTNCALVTNCGNLVTCGTTTNVGTVTNCGSTLFCGDATFSCPATFCCPVTFCSSPILPAGVALGCAACVTYSNTTSGLAATNVQAAIDEVNAKTALPATTTTLGVVCVGTNISVTPAGLISVASSSTSQTGVVQLYDDVDSTSTTCALTAAQGKLLQDQITALSVSGGVVLAGTLNATTGNMVSVTSQGAGATFAVGSPLPAASATTNNYYAIVTVSGTVTPPGGSATAATQGDWFLVSETSPGVYAWTFLNVGFDAPVATTATAGVVQLATNAQAQAGTDTANAVTSAALQSKVSDSVSTTSSTTIASSTAVKTAYDLANAAIPKTALTAKGAIISASAANTVSTLNVGADSQMLVACSTAASGLCWVNQPAAAIPCACITAKGSLITGTAANTPTALAVGTNAQVLMADSACAAGIKWATILQCTGTVTSVTAGTGLTGGTVTTTGTIALNTACVIQPTIIAAKGDLITGTAPATPSVLTVGTDGQVLVACSACTSGLTWGSVPAATPTVLGAVYGCTTSSNTALGCNALVSSSVGASNTAIGVNAGCAITTGQLNTVLGRDALFGNVTTGCNTIIGGCSFRCSTVYGCNAVVGSCVAPAGTGMSFSAVLGHCALSSAGATFLSGNTALGALSLRLLTAGDSNTAVGGGAGSALRSGSFNVFLGLCAGGCDSTVTLTGSCNVAIGSCLELPNPAGSCQLAIGYASGCCWLTGDSTKAIRPGAGIVDCAGSCGLLNQVLVSTGANAVRWCSAGLLCGYTCTATPFNTALGYCAGVGVTGLSNTLIGMNAGCSLTTGGCNILIGDATGSSLNNNTCCNVVIAPRLNGTYSLNTVSSNNIAISSGGNALYSLGAPSNNIIQLGNTAHTAAYINVNWTAVSDIRDKTEIADVALGLDFIRDINPIQYKRCDRETNEILSDKVYYGFSAQEIKEKEISHAGKSVIVDESQEERFFMTADHLNPVFVNAIKELADELDRVKAELAALKANG